MNPDNAERNFTTSLIAALYGKDPTPTAEEVNEFAQKLADLSGFKGDIQNSVVDAMIAIDTRMGRGVSLVGEAPHDEEWVRKRDIEWTYSESYERYLREQGWPGTLVETLSDVGLRILGHVQDPMSTGSWDRRGLVIGHVQSGKTANYLGVVGKAADAGYKFIIVIAGIHNNLRKQTQERIDEGFIGRSSDPTKHREEIGVGTFFPEYPHPVTITNIHSDFNKSTASKSGWQINDFRRPVILVVKKNVTTLRALHGWLADLNAKDGVIADVPMLMIDDEADNASINTNKPELDPTQTNSWIRQIVGLFAKTCYVGYTATPFANIFINPDAYDERARDELFPKDFIYCLDAPNSYFGPQKVFLDEDSSKRVLEVIEDAEDVLPLSHKKGDLVVSLPKSLYEAIDTFFLARAIRNLRGQAKRHCSMMVNVSRFTDIQKEVKAHILSYEKRVREAVLANAGLPLPSHEHNNYMARLRNTFESAYLGCQHTWADVRTALPTVFENLKLFVINSNSDEALDYKKYEDDGDALTAIAVGGLSLSRGLTIEGLCVSYMYRNTSMYDTLMQMGRWFGYRPGYEDLCRVFLSQDSIDWYEHIAEKTEDLRQQIRRMRQFNLTPKQFGLYVESHPANLLITAANKMRHGEERTLRQSLTGQLIETHFVPDFSEINRKNEELIAKYWQQGFSAEKIEPTDKGWILRDVSVTTIHEFLVQFNVSPEMEVEMEAARSYLREVAEKYPTGDVLLISVKENGQDEEALKLGSQMRPSAGKYPKDPDVWEKSDTRAWRLSKDRVASRGDERLGLDTDQINEAVQFAITMKRDDPSIKSDKPSDVHYRHIRKKPLLMVHVLSALGDDNNVARVPALGISFPFGDFFKTVKVVVNKVYVSQMVTSHDDDPDDEDDYDSA